MSDKAKATITRAEIRRIARKVYEECEEEKKREEARRRLQDAINKSKAVIENIKNERGWR